MHLSGWRYKKSDGSRNLVKIDSSLKSGKNVHMLKDNLIVDLDEDEIFQYDKDSCHRLGTTACLMLV